MTLWIDRAEMVFQQALQKEEIKQKALITWWFPKSHKWKQQKPSDPVTVKLTLVYIERRYRQ